MGENIMGGGRDRKTCYVLILCPSFTFSSICLCPVLMASALLPL